MSKCVFIVLFSLFPSLFLPAGPPAENPDTLELRTRRWGAMGHRIVGQIAENHLTDKAKEGVKSLLGHESLAQVSTWADEIRSDPNWRKASPWHYVTVEDNQTLKTATRNPAGDIHETILRYEQVLRDINASKEDRATALKFLVHMIGDIHQPVHVGRGADRGGNSIRVKWMWESSNLHRVWDTDLIESEGLSYTEFVNFIDHASDEDIAKWQGDNVDVWAAESKALRDQVYDLPEPDNEGNVNLSYRYRFKNMDTIKLRLVQAGIRLAGLLNDVFK